MPLNTITKKGSTSYILEVSIRSSTSGQLLSGVAYADIAIYSQRQGASSPASIVVVEGVVGTWSSAGWIETTIPGVYQFGVPNVALETGADFVTFIFTASGALDKEVRIYLTGSDLQNANNLGLAYLDEAVSGIDLLGDGAIAHIVTVEKVDHTPIEGALVWMTTDEDGNNRVVQSTTDSFGQVTFYLNSGTYFTWKKKDGYAFTNPEEAVVS